MPRFSRLIILGVAYGVSGCATITSGTTQRIRFESNPAGATAKVSNGASVETPGVLELSRARTYDVSFEKDGFVPAQSHIGQGSNPAMMGNILIGGLIGMLIDSASGAAYVLEPEVVFVMLVEDPQATQIAPGPTANASPPASP